MFRICKSFEVEGGHFLSKHPEKCKNPHGHTRKIEVVLAAEDLDPNDMVCDYKALKLALEQFIDRFDHAMLVNTDSPHFDYFHKHFERVIPVPSQDPTTEVMAKIIFEYVARALESDALYRSAQGAEYRIRQGVSLERVRVWETSSTWAEYWES